MVLVGNILVNNFSLYWIEGKYYLSWAIYNCHSREQHTRNDTEWYNLQTLRHIFSYFVYEISYINIMSSGFTKNNYFVDKLSATNLFVFNVFLIGSIQTTSTKRLVRQGNRACRSESVCSPWSDLFCTIRSGCHLNALSCLYSAIWHETHTHIYACCRSQLTEFQETSIAWNTLLIVLDLDRECKLNRRHI